MNVTLRRDPLYDVPSLPLALSSWLFPNDSYFSAEGSRIIRAEEYVDGKDMVIRLEIPDVDPEQDVDIRVSDNTLCISAERREQLERSQYRTELRYGSYVRTVPLPEGASEKDVHATYKDGILELRVTLPQGKAAKKDESHKVDVVRG